MEVNMKDDLKVLEPKAAHELGTQAGGAHLPVQALKHLKQVPPKAKQSVGTQAGGAHLPVKAVTHLAK
jgi:hypothetical protein